MDRHILHGRHDDPFDIPASVVGIVHGRVPAVLRIVLVAVLGASAYVVEMLTIRIDELDRSAVAIDVNNRPERAPSLNAAEEETLLLAIDTEVHVAGRCDVIEEHRIPLREPLSKRLGPIARLIRQIRTRVPRQTAPKIDRVVASEAETDHTAPIVGDLQELHADLHRSTEKRPCKIRLRIYEEEKRKGSHLAKRRRSSDPKMELYSRHPRRIN